MRSTAFIVGLLGFLAFTGLAEAKDVHVNGYTKSDGTYVQPYTRTSPNNTINDNYSTRPNVNPYTGQPGTRQPDYSYPYDGKSSSQYGDD